MKVSYLLVAALSLYLAALLYLYFTQDNKIFNFSLVKKAKSPVLKECQNCKEVKLKVKGAILDGVVRDENSSKVILYFGGNADDATEFIKIAKDIKGYDIVAFNYRGNALSTGKPSQDLLFDDALKIYDLFAKNKDKIIIVGRSLGSGVASYLASKRETDGVLLITPYDSVENLAKEKYPFFPISLLLKHKFKSFKYAKNIEAPIVIFMVKDDQTVPNKNTKNLEKYIPKLLEEKIFTDTTHADILTDPSFKKELKRVILRF